jgi:predicted lipid-binding transport protein (Tim44 family)
MKKFLLGLCLALSSLTMIVTDAQAARLGSGKSVGMQRNTTAVQQGSTAQRPMQAAPNAAPATPAQPQKRNWMGPLAGLAAGLGIAALLSHFGMGEAVGNFLMIALLGFAALFVIRMLMRRKEAPANNGLQYAGGTNAMAYNAQQPAYGNTAANSYAPEQQFAPNLPAGFDAEGFERTAKVNFLRLQAANDKGDLNDIREFTTPEMYAEIKLDIDARKGASQQTDVVSLDAQLLEVITEGNRHIASVRFSGLIRETAQGAAEPFNEVWNLVKAVEGNQGWQVAGIQQA